MHSQVEQSAAFFEVTLKGREGEHPRLSIEALTLASEVTAVMGESGAGKTSLLNLLVGFERPEMGTVSREGRVAWVPSDLGLWPGYTVREHLEAVGATVEVEVLLERLGLERLAEAFPDTLSLGQRSRLAVARALATPSEWLVMDEPLAHVDSKRRPEDWQVIFDYRASRKLVFSAHDPDAVLALAERVCCLRQGRVTYHGEVRELYDAPASPELAFLLGRANWFEGAERQAWLGGEELEGVCVRPEQLELREGTKEDGVRCLRSRRVGPWGESLLRHEASAQERWLVHRPGSTTEVASGSMGRFVRLHWLGTLLLAWLIMLTGCGDAPQLPELVVNDLAVWRLPIDGPKLPAPRSVAVGPQGEVVVLDDAGRVLVFNEEGELDRRWSMPEVEIGRPEGVVVTGKGEVIVCDTHYHRIMVFDSSGRTLRTFGSNGKGPGEFIYPVAIAQDPEGHLYIGEYGSNDRVQKFTETGEFITAFGAFGTGPGEFQRPSGIAWHDGVVYVADAVNNRIQAFDDEGTFLKEVSLHHGGDAVPLNLPYDLVVSASGEVWVIEYGAGRLLRCSLEGELLGVLGRQGSALGQFQTPWGLAVTAEGNVRVADKGNRRLVAIERTP